MNGPPEITPLVPSTLFDSTKLALHDQFDAWRERISVIFNVEPLDSSLADGFPAEALAYHLGDLVLARTRFEAQQFVRTTRHARADMLDHYLVQFYNEGGYTGELDGHPVEMTAGSVSILDMARATHTRATAAECVSLVVPRDVMGELLPRTVNLHGAVLDSGNGRLFSKYLFSLLRQLPTTQQSQAPHIARATCSLLAACLIPTVAQLDHVHEPIEAGRARACSKRTGCSSETKHRARGVPIAENARFDDWIRALRA